MEYWKVGMLDRKARRPGIARNATLSVLTYGGNFRHNAFDISLAPRGNSRDEGGVYIQDDIFLSEHFRWNVGGRVDKFDVLDDPVFSPRTTFMVKPVSNHTFRLSYNRAYRAPSFINNFMDTAIVVRELPLGLINPLLAGQNFPIVVAAVGNEATGTSKRCGTRG